MFLYEYKEFLDDCGIKRIGSGGFCTAYQHPTHKNIVVKVWDSDDYGYKSWLEFCLKNQDNPLVPKIYHTSEHGYFNITMVEKLYKLEEVDRYNCDWNKHLTPHFDFKPERKFCNVRALSAKHDHSKKILKFLKKCVKSEGTDLDLHDENVMWRGKGKNRQLVITDPLVG